MTIVLSVMFLMFLLGFIIWPFFLRGYHSGNLPSHPDSPKKRTKPSVLTTATVAPPQSMERPSKELLTYQLERTLAISRQRLWIRYHDFNGNETNRKIEIYCPREDDEYLFAWCCSAKEPRTFNRNNIQEWQILAEQFEFNPNVEKYFREEGERDWRDRMPWSRWLEKRL